MKQILKTVFLFFKHRIWFWHQHYLFKKSAKNSVSRFRLSKKDYWPLYGENTPGTFFDRHYVYHTAWAARKLEELKPNNHIDISSSLYFISIASAFCKINFYDYRPARLGLSNLTEASCDLLNLQFEDNSISSLSCMHVIEHIGLGRYGDAIDYNGDLKAIAELKRVVKPNGNLFFVVPIGKAIIQYNAHRIYSYRQVIELFDGFQLQEFALIPDSAKDGGLIFDAKEELADKQRYGCGCFWFVKL